VSGTEEQFDLVIIGGGPAGQKAAIQAAKERRRVLLIEQGATIGGECVHRGTIPSKTLRETAIYLSGLKARSEGVLSQEIRSDLKVESLMRRQEVVRTAHESFMTAQLERNHVTTWRARARFLSPTSIEATEVDGKRRTVRSGAIVIATGSRPRTPSHVPVDHEHVLDSDSILSLIYLPASLTVLGAGVIACEFASIFAALGVRVTIIDQGERALAFLDPELTDGFLTDFARRGGRYLSRRKIEGIDVDGISKVTVTLAGGEIIESEKVLCALGRIAHVVGLNLEAAGLSVTPRGQIAVDGEFRTSVPHIYAAGDVIGPPALAATSMEQGRRAARHALGLSVDELSPAVPVGIYTIPEMASVGLTEAQAIEQFGTVEVGRARFRELARGQICGDVSGLIKLVASFGDRRVLGAHIVGEGATELIHVAQMAMLGGLDIEAFIDGIFNFPTMAEGYRVAALDIASRRIDPLRAAA